MALITRRIGRIVRGKATPFQLLAATLVTAELMFVPGLTRAPGLVVALGALLLCVNANLPLALLLAGPLRLAALALLPLSFAVGRFLLDGPTRGLFERAVDAPGLAWCGLDHYATSGGVVVGAAVGLLGGLVLVRTLSGLRRKLAGLERDSDAYQRLTGGLVARLFLFLFVGGSRGKLDWETLAERRLGNPIRPAGLILVLLGAVGAFSAQGALGESVLTAELRRGLEELNGATVDLAGASLDLARGSLTLRDLALADPDDLERDLFRAATLNVDCSTRDLLRRRLRVERVLVAGASQGERRERAGERFAPPPPPARETPRDERPGTTGLEDHLSDARLWRARLQTLRRWLERLAPREDNRETPEGTAPPASGETLAERLEREVHERGYAAVRAPHLSREGPRVHVSELIVEELRLAALGERSLRISALDLSSDPELLERAPRLSAVSDDGDLRLELDLGAPAAGGESGRVLFTWHSIPAAHATGALARDGHAPFSGGTLDLTLDGRWSPRGIGHLDLPLEIVLHDTLLRLGSGEEARVERLAFGIGLSGPLDELALEVDGEALADALVQAGADALADALRERADEARAELEGRAQEAVDEAREELREQAAEAIEQARGELREQTDGAVEEAVEEAREELGERADELLEGLLDDRRRGGLLDGLGGRGSRKGGGRSGKRRDGR
ncbi:MAG: hypothetical protein QGI46_09910 [Planctomycetota bacterium]|jgi:hypothetical protein|nr:hypothetical protein [Planctomycetota bacterium]